MPNRSEAPAFRIPDSIDLPLPEIHLLKNGIRVHFIPSPQVEAVKLEVLAKTNPSDISEKLLPYFCLEMLTRGTKSKDASNLDHFFDFYASGIDPIVGYENQGLSLVTTKKHFQKVLPVFRELFSESIFPDKELNKIKKQKKLSIHINKQKNSQRASQLFRQQLFGKQHYFGKISDEGDVDHIHSDLLKAYYSSHLWNNPEIFVTGNLDDEDMRLLVNLFENLVTFSNENPSAGFNTQIGRLSEFKTDSLQSSIRIGCTLIPRSHPDHHALFVMNTALGGYFGSRLIKNIREEKGLTYGIYSLIGALREKDYWVVMADVAKTNTQQAIDEVYLEIEKIKSQALPEEEIEVVRNFLIGKILGKFSSGFELIDLYKDAYLLGLDLDYYQDQLTFIKNFNTEQLMASAEKYLDQSKMVEVIVG